MKEIREIPALKKSDIERFWSKVKITANDNLCWEWAGSKFKRLYGQFSINHSINLIASRVAYKISYPEDDMSNLCVCHTCDNPGCCNPKHLFLGTTQDNVNDREKKGRGNGSIGEWREKNIHLYIGEGHNKSKLTNEQVREIRKKHVFRKITYQMLANEYSVSWSTVQRIVSDKNWTHIK